MIFMLWLPEFPKYYLITTHDSINQKRILCHVGLAVCNWKAALVPLTKNAEPGKELITNIHGIYADVIYIELYNFAKKTSLSK